MTSFPIAAPRSPAGSAGSVPTPQQPTRPASTRRDLIRLGAGVGGATLLALVAGGLPDSDAPALPRRFGLSVAGRLDDAGPAGLLPAALAAGDALGRRPDVVNGYVAWEWGAPFPADWVRRTHAAGVRPQLTWEPWDPRGGAEQPAYRLSDIDRHRTYVDAFARAAAEVDLPFTLRFAHEMNGFWYPWSTGVNQTTAAHYRDAYRWLRERFRAAGADRVRWTWSVNAWTAPSAAEVGATFPGVEHVDVVSVDGYDLDGVLTPRAIFADVLPRLRELAPGLPLWVDEVGTTRRRGRAAWVRECLDYLAGTEVVGVSWFDIVLPDGRDFRISTPGTAAGVRTAVRGWR